MATTPTAAAARAARSTPPAPFADRDIRRGETAPLNAPITAAFIGLLLMRDAVWAEETAAADGDAAAAGAPGPLPPAGADAAGVRTAPGLGEGAQLALARGAAAAPEGAPVVAPLRLVQAGDTHLAGAGENVFQLGGEGRPIAVTLEGLEINGMPLALATGGALPDGEAELESLEDTHYDGLGYLAKIENVELGTAGDDVLIGTSGNDYISGLDGDDEIYGRAGNDVLHGDAGDDRVFGEAGNDLVYGDAGDDYVDGGDGSDIVEGGAGSDTLVGGDSTDWGFDNLYGGFGPDSYRINHISDIPDESWVADAGRDDFRVSSQFIDDFTGTKPYFTAADSVAYLPDHVEKHDYVHVSKGIENVLLNGAWDADIYGGSGANRLVGNAGANTIKGFDGDDVLDGRGGVNRLDGGRGADTYLIDTGLDGVDTIADADGPDALTANTLRFKGVDRADLAIARDGSEVTFSVDEVLRAEIVGYDADGPVFHVATDDARFDLFGVNHAPRLNPDWASDFDNPAAPNWSVSEGGIDQLPLSADLFVDVDIDDDVRLDARLAGGEDLPSWLSFEPSTGLFVAAPDHAAAGDYEVILRATDVRGATASTAFELTVTDVNRAPEALWRDADVVFSEDAAAQPTYDLSRQFRDADAANALTYKLTTEDGGDAPGWLQLAPETGVLSGDPGVAPDAPLELVVTASDGLTSATIDLTVGVEPAPPVVPLAGADFGFGLEDDVIQGSVLGNDVHPDGLPLTAELADGPTQGIVSLNPNGSFVYTPGADFSGQDSFSYRAVADGEASAPAVVELYVVPVNDAPEIVAGGSVAVREAFKALELEEGQAASATVDLGSIAGSLSVPAIFEDVDADELRYSAELDGSAGLLPTGLDGGAWLAFDPTTRTFSIQPGANDGGTHTVWLSAEDPAGEQASFAIPFDVAPQNQAPVILDDHVPYEHGATIMEGEVFDLEPTAHFRDPDADDTIHLEIARANDEALPSWLVFHTGTHELRVTPGAEAGAFGRIEEHNSIVLTVRAVDEIGATSEPTLLTVTVEPLPALLEPVELTDVQQPHEGEDFLLKLDGRFRDDPSAVLSLGGDTGLPEWLTFDAKEGTFTGTPDNDDVGTFKVTVEATDAAEHADDALFELAVQNTNDAPVAIGALDDVTVTEGEAVSFTLPATATLFDDVDLIHGDALTLSAPDAPGWLHFDPSSRTFSDPAAPDVAADETITITVVATDAAGATAEIPFELTIEAINHAPQLAKKITSAPSATEGQSYYWDLDAELFTDPDGDALSWTVDAPEWMSFEHDTHTFTGRPTVADPGTYTIQLTATDPSGLSADTVIPLKVHYLNDAPVVAAPIAPILVSVGESIGPIAIDAAFADADEVHGDVLDFDLTMVDGSADGSALPLGLEFDGTTLTGSVATAGSWTLRATATDDAGDKDTDDFKVTVEPRSEPTDPGGPPDVALNADGTVPASVLGAEAAHSPEVYFSDRSGNLFYAEGEQYWTHSSIDYIRISNKKAFAEDHVTLEGDKRTDVLGNDAANIVLGNDGDNLVIGQGGDDILSGAGGADALYGGDGDDVLAGGAGADELYGGAGDDRYEIGGLQDGAVDTIYDDGGADVVDLDGVNAGRLSFEMDGADLVVAVDGNSAVQIADFPDRADGTSSFEVQADDQVWDHAALLVAVQEMQARNASFTAQAAPQADVLEGFLGEAAEAAGRGDDPLAAFTPAGEDGGGEALQISAGEAAGTAGLDEAGATFVTPDGMAPTTQAAAAGLASKPAAEEEPAYG